MSGPVAPASTKTRSDLDLDAWLREQEALVAGWQDEHKRDAAPRPEKAPAIAKPFARAFRLLRGSLEMGDLAAVARLATMIADRAGRACPAVQALAAEGADALMRRDLPPVRWVIEDLLPVGLTLLVGPPKSGKSILGLQIAQAAASGDPVLGRAVAQPGAALYLALEDGPGRVRERLARWDVAPAPGLAFRFGAGPEAHRGWPRLDQGGLDALSRYHDAHPTLGLVVVDVLACVRPARQRGESGYDADFQALHGLGLFAAERSVGLISLHHTRKRLPGEGDGGDQFEMVNGTTGLLAAVDAALILRRRRFGVEGSLLMTGRDREEATLDLRLDPELVRWELGPVAVAQESVLTRLQRQILDAVEQAAGSLAAQELYRRLAGSSPDSIRRIANRLVDRGLLARPDRGTYRTVPTVPTVPIVPNGGENGTIGTNGTNGTADVHETATSDTTAAREEVQP